MQWLGDKDVIHPYAGVYSVMADLVRDKDEQVVEDFYWYLLHSTAAHAFPEGITTSAAMPGRRPFRTSPAPATTPSSFATCWSTSRAMNSTC